LVDLREEYNLFELMRRILEVELIKLLVIHLRHKLGNSSCC